MSSPQHRTLQAWGDLVRKASTHQGPWPSIQVWQGTADQTVAPGNAEELVRQWADVLRLPEVATETETVDGARHEIWRGADGRPALERWTVPGLGHGTPIRGDGADADQTAGIPGPHMLVGPISSTWHLAHSWGLLTQAARPAAARAGERIEPQDDGPASVIGRALRAAGVLR